MSKHMDDDIPGIRAVCHSLTVAQHREQVINDNLRMLSKRPQADSERYWRDVPLTLEARSRNRAVMAMCRAYMRYWPAANEAFPTPSAA